MGFLAILKNSSIMTIYEFGSARGCIEFDGIIDLRSSFLDKSWSTKELYSGFFFEISSGGLGYY